MKTLTTLAAVVALIAGMSIANAASSSSMGKSNITGMSKFCVKGSSGALNCKYASLSACQTANKGKTCEANPKSSTTGSK
jgi:hypothetical protein